MQPDTTPRRILVGAKEISTYCGRTTRWLYRTIDFRPNPPPVYQPAGPGTAIIGFVDELDIWLRSRKPQPQ
jgi:hypothetical protein